VRPDRDRRLLRRARTVAVWDTVKRTPRLIVAARTQVRKKRTEIHMA
jgi:hypothetical protein